MTLVLPQRTEVKNNQQTKTQNSTKEEMIMIQVEKIFEALMTKKGL